MDWDGKQIATASRKGTAKLWDAQTGALLRTLEGHSGEIWHVEFSQDGVWLA